MFEINSVRQQMQKVIEEFDKELRAFRIGRANPSLLENVEVNAYGSKMPISQLANINVVDAHLLTVQPWDKSNLHEINKAILEAGIGLNPLTEGDFIRIPIPPITEERRLELVKHLGQIGEESKVKIRQVRKEILDHVKKSLDAKEITEDDEKRQKDQLQKVVDEFNATVEDMIEKKKTDLLTV